MHGVFRAANYYLNQYSTDQDHQSIIVLIRSDT